MYESWDEGTFGDMPDLSHRNPYVYAEILKLARWLVEEIGFDGFRYDFVKGYGANTIAAIQEYRYMRDGQPFSPYGVAEFWDNAHAIEHWVNVANFSNSNPVDAFDFPLREMLKALCDQYGFSLRNLATWETVFRNSRRPRSHSSRTTTCATRAARSSMTNCWLTLSSWHTRAIPAFSGATISTTTWRWTAHPTASLRWSGHTRNTPGAAPRPCGWIHLYIMQRTGHDDKPGLVYVLNNHGDNWRGGLVNSRWPNASFEPVAWWSKFDMARPIDQTTDRDGRAHFYAAPRGYAIYAFK
jgi:alpha-amylase